MDDTPPDVSGPIDPAKIPDSLDSIGKTYRIGDSFKIPEFKETTFLNGLFLTIVAGLILGELGMISATLLKIHLVDIYYSQFSKTGFVDPNHSYTRANLTMVDKVVAAVYFGNMAILIFAIICMLFWMFRNYKNSIALVRTRLRYSAGAATAGLVIPIINWYRPYVAVAEMVKIAKDRLNWTTLKTPLYVHLWWFFSLGGFAAAVIARLITASISTEPTRFYFANYGALLVYCVNILRGLLLMRIVLVIWKGIHQWDQIEPVSDLELPRVD